MASNNSVAIPANSDIAMRLFNEGPIELAQGAACFADDRGRKPHIATIRRWANRGCRGHRLEVVFLGNRLMTSRQAVARFLAAINGLAASAQAQTTSAAERAGRELDDLLS